MTGVLSLRKLTLITIAPPIGFGLSIKALPPQGTNPAEGRTNSTELTVEKGCWYLRQPHGWKKCDAIQSGGSSSTEE